MKIEIGKNLCLIEGAAMKFVKTKLLAIIAGSMVLVGCNNNQLSGAFVEVGFEEYYGASNPTSQVGLAFKAQKEQSLNATFNVYIGARKGFVEDWRNDLWGCNPGRGKFAINRVIEDEAGNEIKNDFIVLDDFPNDEKYPLTYEAIEGTLDGVAMHFEGFVVDTCNFSSIDALKGSIGYYICYYDDINQRPFEGDYYLYGVSWGGKLNFEKKDENIVFESHIL